MAADGKDADAEYIAGQCRQLAELARYSGFELGSYLLSVAELEFAKHFRAAGSRAKTQRDSEVSA